MKIETRQVYISDDGKTFDTASECEAHEIENVERNRKLSELKLWAVHHDFDQTEGRGYYAHTLVLTNSDLPVLIQWCLDTFGPPLARWYGDGFFEAWRLARDDRPLNKIDWAMKQAGNRLTANHGPTRLVVVSKDDWSWSGLPASEFPWPRKGKQ